MRTTSKNSYVQSILDYKANNPQSISTSHTIPAKKLAVVLPELMASFPKLEIDVTKTSAKITIPNFLA